MNTQLLEIPPSMFINNLEDFNRYGRIRMYILCEMIRKANER